MSIVNPDEYYYPYIPNVPGWVSPAYSGGGGSGSGTVGGVGTGYDPIEVITPVVLATGGGSAGYMTPADPAPACLWGDAYRDASGAWRCPSNPSAPTPSAGGTTPASTTPAGTSTTPAGTSTAPIDPDIASPAAIDGNMILIGAGVILAGILLLSGGKGSR